MTQWHWKINLYCANNLITAMLWFIILNVVYTRQRKTTENVQEHVQRISHLVSTWVRHLWEKNRRKVGASYVLNSKTEKPSDNEETYLAPPWSHVSWIWCAEMSGHSEGRCLCTPGFHSQLMQQSCILHCGRVVHCSSDGNPLKHITNPNKHIFISGRSIWMCTSWKA